MPWRRRGLDAVLLPRLPVVQVTHQFHVEQVGRHRAREPADVVQRREVLEPEDLRDDGEEQRHLRPEAEADHHGGDVERPGHAEGDQQVTGAGDGHDHREEERARQLVPRKEDLRPESGGDAAGVVPYADERHEGAGVVERVAERLADLAHVVDGRKGSSDAADRGEEEDEHVEAEERLEDRVVFPSFGRLHGGHDPPRYGFGWAGELIWQGRCSIDGHRERSIRIWIWNLES